MDIVLLERIDKLGNMGDVVSVRPGYARNFLLPQGKALRATKESIARFDAERVEREEGNLQRHGKAAALRERLERVHVTLIRQAADNLQLYGSVKARDIAGELSKRGFEVDMRNVVLDRPIKTLGLFEVTAVLHPEVSVTVIANVARTLDEAMIQEATGKTFSRQDDADEEATAVETEDEVAETEVDAESGEVVGDEPETA